MTRKRILCYIGSMRHFLFIFTLLACILPVQAGIDFEKILGELLNVETPAAAAPASGSPAATPPGLGDSLVLTLRSATDNLLEAYKEEGREYAREVGDVITQRMLENEKVNDTLNSVRYLCWGVVGYLTIVTLIIIVLLLRLRVLYARLTAGLQKEEGHPGHNAE